MSARMKCASVPRVRLRFAERNDRCREGFRLDTGFLHAGTLPDGAKEYWQVGAVWDSEDAVEVAAALLRRGIGFETVTR